MSKFDVSKVCNIGISAHIDSGKTTLTERILFYTGKIHAMHEVKGKDGVGAVMDFMELEKERGITITSASTCAEWKDHIINVIDTPGHVDFTVEVERSLKVLDSAILVLCAVGGVQSQSITVDRQMKRYGISRIAFINKCDRTGANPLNVVKQLREQLGLNAVLLQLPIGSEDEFNGIVDIISNKALYFDGKAGEDIRIENIPENMLEQVKEMHEKLEDALSLISDEFAEKAIEKQVTEEIIKKTIREATIKRELVPVLLGSAYKNKGIQTLLDAIIDYLPCPLDINPKALDKDKNEEEVLLKADSELPTVLNAFKLEDGKYGQLTYIRIYQGMIRKGCELTNTRTSQEIRIGRLVRMHADKMEEISEAYAGDIVALFGVDCASGDTFTSDGLNYTMSSMFVPKPVISLSVKAPDKKTSDLMSRAIGRFTKEDPTFISFVDPESNQTIIQGMGELHLDIYIERIKREYGFALETGKPQVAYRETISRPTEFNYTHKKQSGGAGQYARIAGIIEPLLDKDYEFVDEIRGGVIPREYIPSCDKGFSECMKKGTLIGFPITGVKVTINDGAYHAVDSSDMAFRVCAITAFRESYSRCSPVILEPIMSVSVEGPADFQGTMLATLNQRRGTIVSVTDNGIFIRVDAHVPLAEMFGYSTSLRSSTQGKAEFSMEFCRYERVPESIAELIKKEYSDKALRIK